MENRNNLNLQSENVGDLTPLLSTSNLNLTSVPNINVILNTNQTGKTHEAQKIQKSKNNNTTQHPFKLTRYIPLPTRRKVFQRANHCCEFIGLNLERQLFEVSYRNSYLNYGRVK